MGLVNQQEYERLLKTFEAGKYIYFDGNVIDYIIRGWRSNLFNENNITF